MNEKKLTFMANKGWNKGENDRGGIQYLLKAFTNEFTKNDDVRLLVKLNPSYLYPGWDLNNELNKLNLKMEDVAEIKIEMNYMTDKELNNFYNDGDIFISPTMGEAFNIPCIEAMACGLPVITTNFGGQTDYVNESNGWLIDGEMVDVNWDLNYEGVRWFKPNVQELQKVMRNIYEKYKNKDVYELTIKSTNAILTSKNYTWQNSCQKILEIINLS